ncbi:hypothetical protein E2P81_ATG05679 [Venturia nashicola]|uniref:Uncharacterized protein n=1 Tax=Venturia nashicola TaxID=86259 RepID=A0A4Z1NSE3_9PEZI|nr:hypothetical protein E6O75_ATG05817 [Venturia nashicola]TLD29385.1 hypothetical protein E2P81_ATG05679 [Venturia nashicola]
MVTWHYLCFPPCVVYWLPVFQQPYHQAVALPKTLKNGMISVIFNGATRPFPVNLPKNCNNKNPTARSSRSTQRAETQMIQHGQIPIQGGGKASGIVGSFAKVITAWLHTGGKYGEQDLDFVDKVIETMDENS